MYCNPGEIICIEHPLVWIHGHHPFVQSQLEEMAEKVSMLVPEEKEAFFAMANSFTDASSLESGIFMTNCFDMTESIHGEACAIYCAIGRLNHSCQPNTQQTHIPETSEEILCATKVIEIGDEINDCYIELRQSKTNRQSQLLELYGFLCTCPACSLPSEESLADDAKRTRANKLECSMLEIAESDESTALTIALQYLQLLTEGSTIDHFSAGQCGGALQWSSRYIAEAYLYVYHLYLASGKKKPARLSLELAHAWNVLLQSSRSLDSVKTATLLGK